MITIHSRERGEFSYSGNVEIILHAKTGMMLVRDKVKHVVFDYFWLDDVIEIEHRVRIVI